MFNETWKWAGRFRTTDKNIGAQAYQIPIELQNLLDDARYWIEHKTFKPDELAVRFHYRLVSIHLFPNGNGPHARLVADALAVRQGRPPFSWGNAKFADAGKARTAYLNALTEADNGNYGPLVAFARKLIDSLACVKNNVLEANPGQRIYIFEPSQTPVDEAKMEVKTTMKQLIMTIIKNRQFAS